MAVVDGINWGSADGVWCSWNLMAELFSFSFWQQKPSVWDNHITSMLPAQTLMHSLQALAFQGHYHVFTFCYLLLAVEQPLGRPLINSLSSVFRKEHDLDVNCKWTDQVDVSVPAKTIQKGGIKTAAATFRLLPMLVHKIREVNFYPVSVLVLCIVATLLLQYIH